MPDAPTDLREPVLETRLVAPADPGPPARTGLAVGGVLSSTMRAWWAHAFAFSAITLVVFTPMLAASAVFVGLVARAGQGSAPEPRELAWRVGVFLAGTAATLVLSVFQMGAVIYATVQWLNGARAPLGRMLAVGARRGLPVIGTWIVVSIVTVAGMFLLFVPGLLFLVAACVAVPAAVVERPGVAGAIRRSFELTRGSRWRLFAAGLAVVAVGWLLSAIVQVGVTFLVVLFPPGQALVATFVASQLGSALFSVLPVIAVAVCYRDLRRAKEGVDTAELARVFE